MKKIFKKLATPINKQLHKTVVKNQFEKRIQSQPLKLVIGASGLTQKGWIKTEQAFLDLLDESTWQHYFPAKNVEAILAEHVWEHLNMKDGQLAAGICYTYLKPNGYLRIAVPDGYHPSEDYINHVKPGGSGIGADEHKVLYTYQSLKQLLEQCGFEVKLLEYFDENGNFHHHTWHEKDGFIHRSKQHDKRNKNGELNYTSLIIDAIKSTHNQ